MKQILTKYFANSVFILSEGGGLSINICFTLDVDYNLLQQRAEAAGIFSRSIQAANRILCGWDLEGSR